jgi:hypothetical protein
LHIYLVNEIITHPNDYSVPVDREEINDTTEDDIHVVTDGEELIVP